MTLQIRSWVIFYRTIIGRQRPLNRCLEYILQKLSVLESKWGTPL